jgi:hypothetical protein
MTKSSDGESVSIPWCGGEGVDIHVQGSNLELTEYQYLLQKALQELASAAGTDFSRRYFNTVRGDSKIATFERYVRIKREYGEKLTRADGVFLRLMHLAADLDDAEWVYSGHNEDGVPKRHAFDVDPTTASQLVAGHSLGKRLKCYHPKYVRSEESDDDPLSSPTLRAAFHKSLQDEAVRWSDRAELNHELEEIIVNLLRWAGIPTTLDPTAFVEDDHFSVRPSELSVGRFEDPTPALEAEQDQLLVTTLGDLTDNGEALLKTLATDGGQHVDDAADEIGTSTRTVYRAVDALGDLVDFDNGLLRLTSEKIRQEVSALVESLESFAESTASAVARLCKVETRSAADSALQRWMHKYGVELVQQAAGDAEGTLRFDTVMSMLRSSDVPHLEEVLQEGLEAWTKTGRDATRFRSLHYETDVRGGSKYDGADSGFVGRAVG